MDTEDLVRRYVRETLLEYSDSSCRYESSIIKSLKMAGAAGRIKRAACNDANRPDADIKIDDQVYYVEVKSSPRAQMGGGSVGYSVTDKKFYPVGKNRDLSAMIAELLNSVNDTSLHKGLKTLTAHLSRSAGKPITEIPMSGFTPEAWEEAREYGLLQAINRTFESDMSVIARHYAQKNTHYIQINNRGFFSLGENPAGLPIPQLAGRVQLEVRLAKAGDEGRSRSKAGLRVQARLLTQNTSPYSLDDPTDVERLINDRGAASKKSGKRRPTRA